MLQPSFDYKVWEMNQLTPTHLQLKLKPVTKHMIYKAGQYLYLKYPNGQYFPFSIANVPSENLIIELHIRLSPKDFLTNQFVADLSISNLVTIAGPFGECYYVDKKGPLLLLAVGTGFAPAKAIIEKLITTNLKRDCWLYWTVKRMSDIYLPDLVKYWQVLIPNFHFTLISTEIKNTTRTNILQVVIENFEDMANCQIYVFGPQSLAINTLSQCLTRGLQTKNFFTDMLTKDQIAKVVSSAR